MPEEALVTLPDDLGWEQAAFVEPFANAVNAWELSGADAGCSVAILGAGGLGLGLVACAAGTGCAQTAVSDLSQTRLDAAAELGAATCGNDTETHPEGSYDSYDSYDVVFDTVGSVDSRRRAIDLTRKAGTCVLMGFAAPDLEANAGAFIRSQRRILGAFVYSMTQFQTAVSLAARCKADWVANLSFAEVEPLLQRYLEGDFSTVKSRPATQRLAPFKGLRRHRGSHLPLRQFVHPPEDRLLLLRVDMTVCVGGCISLPPSPRTLLHRQSIR